MEKDTEKAQRLPLLNSGTARPTRRSKLLTVLRVLMLICLGAVLLTIGALWGARLARDAVEMVARTGYVETEMSVDDGVLETPKFCKQLKARDLMKHVRNLASIGLNSPTKSRAVGIGYNLSAAYVEDELRRQEICEPQRQYFQVPVWRSGAKPFFTKTTNNSTIRFQENTDFRIMRYGGIASNLTNVAVQTDVCHSCNATFTPGQVALVFQSPNCTVYDQAIRAQNAGAVGLIYSNSGRTASLQNGRVRIVDWKEGDPLVTIPVINVIHSVGMQLAQDQSPKITLRTFSELELHSTFNVLCEIPGKKNDTIIVGTHLDGVEAGPGANDNGSGSSFALALAPLIPKKPLNTILFAWWGAEELGLLGSYHYVRQLKLNGDHRHIKLNLNFDMMGSPNHAAFVYDGKTAPADVQQRCQSITQRFVEHFDRHGKVYTLAGMAGRSDFLPFVLGGIPAGGLLTGAEGIKSMQDRIDYGGFANAAYDPCYHGACDTFENVSPFVMHKMSHAGCAIIGEYLEHPNLGALFDRE